MADGSGREREKMTRTDGARAVRRAGHGLADAGDERRRFAENRPKTPSDVHTDRLFQLLGSADRSRMRRNRSPIFAQTVSDGMAPRRDPADRDDSLAGARPGLAGNGFEDGARP